MAWTGIDEIQRFLLSQREAGRRSKIVVLIGLWQGEIASRKTKDFLQEWTKIRRKRRHRGLVCNLVENEMEKDMLWFVCRYQMVFKVFAVHFLGPSRGPAFIIFKCLQSQWECVDISS